MKQKGMKIAACVLAGVIVFSGISFESDATGVSSVLPVAGLALVLGEGTSVTNMQIQKKSAEATTINPLTKNIIKDIGSSEPVTVSTVLGITKETVATVTDAESETKEPEVIAPPVIPEVPTVSGNTPVEPPAETPAPTPTPTPDADPSVSSNEVTVSSNEISVSENKLTEEEKEYSGLVIAKVDNYVNVRDDSSEEGEVVGKLYDKSVGTLLSEKDGWYEIQSGDVTGYVKAEYVVTGNDAVELAKKVGNRIATVTTTTLKVREQAGLDTTVLGLVPIEDELSVLEEMDGWVKVSIEEGEGYVSLDYVTLSTQFVKAESKAAEEARLKKEEDARKSAHAAAAKATSKPSKNSESGSKTPVISAGSSTGSSVASFATQFVGNPYVYGGTSLTNGADCSGFVMSVYNNYGISLPHSSGAQRSVGYDVGGLANAQPGDIVAYSGHVGIYIGGGNIVHASTAKTGIKISNANYRNVLSVRRIF